MPVLQPYIFLTQSLSPVNFSQSSLKKKSERFLYFQEEIFANHNALPAAQTKQLFTDI